MKWKILLLVGLISLGAIAPARAVRSQEARSDTGQPQQNDLRPPTAKVNPTKPIQVRVISQTNVPVVARVVAKTDDQLVAPGQSVTFGRLHTTYLPLPFNIQVSLQNTPAPDQPIGVLLDAKTSGNEIILTIKTESTVSGTSSRAIRVDKQGAVYLF